MRLALAAMALLIVGVGCAKAPIPESDSTPPQLSWVVVDGETHERTETPADQYSSTVEVKGHAIVTLVAKDSGGVHRIRRYDPAHGWTCVNGSVASSTGPGLISSFDEQKLNPDAQGLVLTEIVLLDSVYFGASCNPGWTLMNEAYYYQGEAENYFGGVTTSSLVVVHTP